jgi:hypothetical protein
MGLARAPWAAPCPAPLHAPCPELALRRPGQVAAGALLAGPLPHYAPRRSSSLGDAQPGPARAPAASLVGSTGGRGPLGSETASLAGSLGRGSSPGWFSRGRLASSAERLSLCGGPPRPLEAEPAPAAQARSPASGAAAPGQQGRAGLGRPPLPLPLPLPPAGPSRPLSARARAMSLGASAGNSTAAEVVGARPQSGRTARAISLVRRVSFHDGSEP